MSISVAADTKKEKLKVECCMRDRYTNAGDKKRDERERIKKFASNAQIQLFEDEKQLAECVH